ncbi:hypothetical protein K438DRAFT_1995661 [Mycena galopus ATCC 62051]|nr:hypothetical protein K438DRAFT_1995661 [Mycena galopus ATCC 62051]
MFNLGIRKDPQNTPPSISFPFESRFAQVEPYQDITVLLQNGGINLTSIDVVIWSHAHFDHVGDMSLFPNTTEIIIGPATNASIYPADPDASLQASDFAGHVVTKFNFANVTLVFSGMKVVDNFGDGSLYLLDTPGVNIMMLLKIRILIKYLALAWPYDWPRPRHTHLLRGPGQRYLPPRWTSSPASRLPKGLPLPAHLLEESKSAVSTDYFWSHDSTLGSFDLTSRVAQLLSLPDLPNVSFCADPVTAGVTLEKAATFDADPDFFIVTAHDISLRSSIPYFPAYINSWHASGLKDASVWNFIDQTNPTFVFSPINATS